MWVSKKIFAGITAILVSMLLVASGFVRWSSTSAPDSSGAAYPGPGTFGVSTSGYCVESVI